jgi:hypothetical protein
LGFAPKITPEAFISAFTTAEGWGSFQQLRKSDIQHEIIELRWGKLNLNTLAFVVPENFKKARVTARLGRQIPDINHTLNDRQVEITFNKKITINENQRLYITIQQQDK